MKIMLIYRGVRPDEFKQMKKVSLEIKEAVGSKYEIHIINDDHGKLIFKSLKPDITLCLAECGEKDESWNKIQRVYEEIKKIISPNQKIIRLGISTLQEGCKDTYYLLPIEKNQWQRILNI